jgi:hypothetical protein
LFDLTIPLKCINKFMQIISFFFFKFVRSNEFELNLFILKNLTKESENLFNKKKVLFKIISYQPAIIMPI